MEVINSYLTNNPCYKANRKIKVKGLMLHSVGCSQPRASVFINSWNKATYDRACVHAFIDGLNGNVYQCLPWNHRGWHGGGSSNNTHIGVEMCEPDCITYKGGATFEIKDKERAIEITKRTYNSAVELFAMLCKEYNLNPLKDIVSHREGYKLGIASNHGDPEHLWTQLGLSYTMDSFRKDVNSKLNNNSIEYEELSHEYFIKQISQCVKEIGPKYNIQVVSPIIAQAINESAWGTSNKAKHNNYFGLKYRENRVNCYSSLFIDGSSEQKADGSYYSITEQWYEFKTMKDGVEGYFQFINIDRYKNLKGITDPYEYVKLIRQDGYATSLSYVENITNLINKYNLTQYDKKEEVKEDELYRVRISWDQPKTQIGAYKIYNNALKACKEGYSIYNKKGECVYSNKSNKKSNEEIAKEVMQGKWKNYPERKRLLEDAGYDYATIQGLVNKMLS